MNCRNCGGPIYRNNRYGICSRTPSCNAAMQRAMRAETITALLPRCRLCGGVMRTDAGWNVCSRTPGCDVNRKRLKRRAFEAGGLVVLAGVASAAAVVPGPGLGPFGRPCDGCGRYCLDPASLRRLCDGCRPPWVTTPYVRRGYADIKPSTRPDGGRPRIIPRTPVCKCPTGPGVYGYSHYRCRCRGCTDAHSSAARKIAQK